MMAFRIETKRTKAKRRLSAAQKFAEKKGDASSDVAVTVVASVHDICHMDLLAWKTEKRETKKLLWIHKKIRRNPMVVETALETAWLDEFGNVMKPFIFLLHRIHICDDGGRHRQSRPRIFVWSCCHRSRHTES